MRLKDGVKRETGELTEGLEKGADFPGSSGKSTAMRSTAGTQLALELERAAGEAQAPFWILVVIQELCRVAQIPLIAKEARVVSTITHAHAQILKLHTVTSRQMPGRLKVKISYGPAACLWTCLLIRAACRVGIGVKPLTETAKHSDRTMMQYGERKAVLIQLTRSEWYLLPQEQQ